MAINIQIEIPDSLKKAVDHYKIDHGIGLTAAVPELLIAGLKAEEAEE